MRKITITMAVAMALACSGIAAAEARHTAYDAAKTIGNVGIMYAVPDAARSVGAAALEFAVNSATGLAAGRMGAAATAMAGEISHDGAKAIGGRGLLLSDSVDPVTGAGRALGASAVFGELTSGAAMAGAQIGAAAAMIYERR